MGLADDLETNDELKPPFQMCAVKWVYGLLTPTDHAALVKAIDNQSLAAKKIADVVQAPVNVRLGVDSIRRHRRGICRCSQP